MAYLGNVPARSFISFERQVFTIVNSQTAYTLSHSVTNENDIRLVINNIVQEPGSGKAYTASGTTLTLSAALVNGTDEMYCVFLGRAVGTVNAPAGSVSTSQLAGDAVTEAKIADGAVESEHLNNNVISGQTELAVAPASTDELLISDGGVLKRIDVSLVGGDNTPAFYAKMSSHQGVAHNATVKIQFDTEVFDTDSCYDPSTNYRFTPTTAGKYLVTVNLYLDSEGQGNMRIFTPRIYKNGSNYAQSGFDKATGYENNGIESLTAIVDMNGSSDYLEAYVYHFTQDNSSSDIGGSDTYLAMFTAHKLIGV